MDENLLSVFILNEFTASSYAVVLTPALSLSMNNCFLPEIFIARDLTPLVSLSLPLARLNKSALSPSVFVFERVQRPVLPYSLSVKSFLWRDPEVSSQTL